MDVDTVNKRHGKPELSSVALLLSKILSWSGVAVHACKPSTEGPKVGDFKASPGSSVNDRPDGASVPSNKTAREWEHRLGLVD